MSTSVYVLAAVLLLGAIRPAGAAPTPVASCRAAPPRASPLEAASPAPETPAAELERAAAAAHRAGSEEEAVRLWVAASRRHAADGSPSGRAENLIRAAQGLAALGFSREAVSLLEQAQDIARPLDDPRLDAASSGALAAVLIELDDLERAQQELSRGLERATQADDPTLGAELLETQGELLGARGESPAQVFARSESTALHAGAVPVAARSAAKAARAWLEAERFDEAAAALERASDHAEGLPDGDALARLWIHVARSWELLAEAGGPEERPARQARAAAGYRRGLEIAERTASERTTSYALGELARLYAAAGRSEEALALARRAVAAAQAAGAPEALFRRESQLAGLLLAAGDTEAALRSYRRAVRTLEDLRRRTGGAGLSFRKSVEPVYVGLVDLLLRDAAATGDAGQRVALLDESRSELEELKSAELRDYFQDACLAAERHTRAEELPGAVVVYPVVLPDRLELIVARKGGLERVAVEVSSQEFVERVHQLRELLPQRNTRSYRPHAAQLYDWLVRPIESMVGESDTLVFVPGGALRTIPLAALYDDETGEFLVEKHPVAVIPALRLTDPRALDVGGTHALLAGLTVAADGFPALQAVGSELDAVGSVFAGQRLVDEDFVADSVATSLAREPFGIVHIATHAQFGESPADSFLLTYDGRLGIEQLSALVERTRYGKQPLELLTLSACETAAGNERAALGLAGIAIRSGARSALATLWTVNDQAAAELISEFYRQLAQGQVSKAEALRRAQRSLLATRTYRHPGYWSPFLLISNWM